MANVAFITFAGYPYTPSSLCPDNGLALLAAVLQEAGHSVRILDYGTLDTMRRLYPEEVSRQAAPVLAELASLRTAPPPELVQRLAQLDAALEAHQANETQVIADEIAREVADIEPAAVGFKLWNGDGFTGSVTIAETLRARMPKVKLFAGGPHATWLGSYIYTHNQAFDAIMVGEAEDKITRLVDFVTHGRSLDDVPGLVRSATDVATPTHAVVLDDLPTALYDPSVYPAMAGDQKLKMIVLDDSRGCGFGCAFCTHPSESGQHMRTRSAKRIVDDMESIVTRHGIRAFRFAGSSTPGSLMAEVADEIIGRNLDVEYASFAHFASSRPEHFQLMRKSGLYAMFFGIETASEELSRRALGRAGKLQGIRETVQAAKEAGIAVVCSMIVPMPFETRATFEESVRLLVELRPDAVPVQFPGLLPGSRWFAEPEQFGFEVDIEAYRRENLGYKLKLLFPPQYWKPLPYKLVDGEGQLLDFAGMTRLTGEFIGTLEAQGLLTGVPDDNLLMAHLAGMPPRVFRDQARFWCASGDAAAMGRFVEAHNRGATRA